MGDEVFRMDVPANETLHELFHSPERRYPGTVNGLLAMDDIRARIEGAGAALADESDLAPLSGGLFIFPNVPNLARFTLPKN